LTSLSWVRGAALLMPPARTSNEASLRDTQDARNAAAQGDTGRGPREIDVRGTSGGRQGCRLPAPPAGGIQEGRVGRPEGAFFEPSWRPRCRPACRGRLGGGEGWARRGLWAACQVHRVGTHSAPAGCRNPCKYRARETFCASPLLGTTHAEDAVGSRTCGVVAGLPTLPRVHRTRALHV
jgi:hypothetical protein